MTPVHGAALEERLAKLTSARDWPDGLVASLETLIREGADRDLFRVNPFRQAAAWGVPGEIVVTLFLYAVRAGLFRTTWGLLCKGCGEIVHGIKHLDEVPEHFFCRACARSRPSSLDEHVEVGFTIRREVRTIAFHDPSSLNVADYVYSYQFSQNVLLRDTGKPFIDLLRQQTRVLTDLAPGATHRAELQVEPGWLVGSPRVMISVEGAPVRESRNVELTLAEEGFSPRPTIPPGPLNLQLVNAGNEPQRVFQYFCAEVPYFSMRPYLSGQRLLNDPAFRECLRTAVVRPGAGIPIEDNTLLFTDLCGSTDLYDVEGDKHAFEVVSKHFECLAQVVTRHSGVVVKTMGDAVMASFNRPEDAVAAALDMGPSLRALGNGVGALQPKIGVHRGQCIAVNLGGEVDYFGQTVNVAARLQGEAGANEICISDAVFSEPRVQTLIEGADSVSPDSVQLRGVREPCALFRVTNKD